MYWSSNIIEKLQEKPLKVYQLWSETNIFFLGQHNLVGDVQYITIIWLKQKPLG